MFSAPFKTGRLLSLVIIILFALQFLGLPAASDTRTVPEEPSEAAAAGNGRPGPGETASKCSQKFAAGLL